MNYVPLLTRQTFISFVRGFYTKPISQICVPDVSKFMYSTAEYHSVRTVDFFFLGNPDA